MKSHEDNIHALCAKQTVNSECGRRVTYYPNIRYTGGHDLVCGDVYQSTHISKLIKGYI